MKKFFQLFLAAVLGGLFTVGVSQYYFSQNQPEVYLPSLQVQGRGIDAPPASLANYMTKLPTSLPDFTLVSEMSVNAVVHIRTQYEVRMGGRDRFLDDPIREFFFGPRRGEPQPRQREASGSGVIIKPNGYIITNNHVVEGADKIQVTLNDNRQYEARIIGTDPTTDLAVIKIDIEENDLPHLTFGNSDEVRVGEWVLAIGNPFNLTSTVTAGIVSAKGRNINILGDMAIESFIQTDAAVNRGNSGGALVNTHGELIGINAAIASTTGTFAGYSFAIPSNIAEKVMEDLLEFGEVQRGLLGVTIRDLTGSLAREEGIGINQGVYVVGVEDGSSAEEAGLKEGDVIVGIQGRSVRTTSELIETVGRQRPGDEILVRYYRDGRERETTALLRNIHGEVTFITRDDKSISEILGARFQVISESRKEELDISHGLQVSSLQQGKLRNAGMRNGFIITHVDREKVKSPEDLTRILKDKKGGVLIEGVYPNGARAFYGIGMG